MPVQCSNKLFEFFEKCGGWARPDEDGKKFLYEALYEGFQFSNLIKIHIPNVDAKTFNDWDKFEGWCEDIEGLSIFDIVDENIKNAIFDSSNDTPKKYFKTKERLKEIIIKALRESDSDQIESLTYVEVVSNGKTLILLYFDSDSWTLGWGDSVMVVNSLDELTEDDGFYTRVERSSL